MVQFASITELVVTFRECLVALAPIVTKVGIEWREPMNYDEWDGIASAIYSSVVASAVAYTVEGEGFAKLAPYDMLLRNFGQASCLFSYEFGRDAVFTRLETSEAPFDTAVFCRLNSDGTPSAERKRELLRQLQFRALLRSKDEEREMVNAIIRDD
jgi:hypothetical protein